MTDICGPEEILLRLALPQAPGVSTILSPEDWEEVDRLGAQHRLIPLLHHHLGALDNSNIPPTLYDEWQDAAHRSTLSVLMAQRDLFNTLDILAAHDIEPIVLKGSYLAFACYPQPGLRPLRDVDLWVSPDEAMSAFEALIAAGYERLDPGDPKQALLQRHQMPILEAPGGTPIELHMRMTHSEGGPDPARHVRDWKLAGRTIKVPTPALMLLHLIVHAAYDHRFDNGPLTLSDVAYLLRTDPIDNSEWKALAEPWRAGCDVVLSMLKNRGICFADELISGACDPDAIAMAEALIVQDMDIHGDARAATGPKLGIGATLFPDRERMQLLYGNDGTSWPRHVWRLMTRRLPRFLRGRTHQKARQIGHMDARYRNWLAKQGR